MKYLITLITISNFIILLSSCSKKNDVSSRPTETDSSGMNDVLFIVSDIGKLEALDATTGVSKWAFVLDSNANINVTNIFSSPTYKDGVVYIGSSDYNVYAIDAKTGLKKWSYLTDPIAIAGYGYYYSSPIVVNGVLYIGGDKLYAINIVDGSLKWSVNLGKQIDSSPTVVDGIVYITGASFLYSINASTGEIIKSGATNGFITYKFDLSSPCYYNGQLYAACNYYNNPTFLGTSIFCVLDPETWLLKMQASLPLSDENTSITYSSPTVKNQTLYACSDSTLFAFDLRNYADTLKWKFKATGSFLASSPTADSLRVYVGDRSGKFYAVNASNGNLEWSINAANDGALHGINNSPTLANGVVYFSSDVRLYSVNATTGKLYWFKPTVGKYDFAPSGCVVSKSGKVFHSSISGIEN